MIRVRRPKRGPTHLDGAHSEGGLETARAIAHYRNKKTKRKPFPFKAYGHDTVKDALNKLFKFKCAYCEGSYAGRQPVDVEHFRPKAGYYDEETKKVVSPGYFWLAATWENLLPSCIDCNRARAQIVDGLKVTSGKANRFPLADERHRARTPGRERREKPMLLDPCRDLPEEHLVFSEDGNVAPRIARGKPSPKGEASIAVFGLRRAGLVVERQVHIKYLQYRFKNFESFQRTLAARPSDPETQANLLELMKELREAMAPGAYYSAMARQLIREFLRKQTKGLAKTRLSSI